MNVQLKQTILSKLNRCEHCNSSNLDIVENRNLFKVVCTKCGRTSYSTDDESELIDNWNSLN